MESPGQYHKLAKAYINDAFQLFKKWKSEYGGKVASLFYKFPNVPHDIQLVLDEMTGEINTKIDTIEEKSDLVMEIESDVI